MRMRAIGMKIANDMPIPNPMAYGLGRPGAARMTPSRRLASAVPIQRFVNIQRSAAAATRLKTKNAA